MIHSGMRESQANEMHIENFSLSCVETLLNYFYGYNVNDSIELFQAADFYQLNILKEFCEDNLLLDLDHRNVLEIYRVARLDIFYPNHKLQSPCRVLQLHDQHGFYYNICL